MVIQQKKLSVYNCGSAHKNTNLRSRLCPSRDVTPKRRKKKKILPVTLYGHESWTLKEVDRKAFGVFEREVLRTILGGKQENGIWRRRMNHELYQVYKKVDIIKLIKHGRLRWAGHVVRMPEER